MKQDELANVLPRDAAMALRLTQEIADDTERKIALERVTARIRRQYPQFFRTKKHNED